MKNTEFTYAWYREFINILKNNNYAFVDYNDSNDIKKVILRHDIDFSIDKSLELAKIENKLNVKSTYFVLLKTQFYNFYSKDSIRMLNQILDLGHNIGLHFDEKSYDEEVCVDKAVCNEFNILNSVLNGKAYHAVSMHRPSKKTLESNYIFNDIINSYSEEYFVNYKYISDSRRTWRENPEKIVNSSKYRKMQILTHAFWYNENSINIDESLLEFIQKAKNERFNSLKSNISNLETIFKNRKIYEN